NLAALRVDRLEDIEGPTCAAKGFVDVAPPCHAGQIAPTRRHMGNATDRISGTLCSRTSMVSALSSMRLPSFARWSPLLCSWFQQLSTTGPTSAGIPLASAV